MSKQSRQSKYLEEINNTGEEFLGTDEDELSESEDILFGNDNDLLDSESEIDLQISTMKKKIL